MGKSKFEAVMFYEGGCGSETEYVCSRKNYTVEEALNEAIDESYDIDDYGTKEEIKEKLKQFNPNDFIVESYIRYFPNLGADAGWEIESGYAHCSKARGAVAVYDVVISRIIEALSSLGE